MDNSVVVLDDKGERQLISILRHCLLHTIEVLKPHQNLSIVLPQSGSHKIDSFCNELQETIFGNLPKRKGVTLPEDPLLPSLDIHQFCEGAVSNTEFTMTVEKCFLVASQGNFNVDAFQRCCWKYYEMERKSDISFPKWFSRECTYRLWLIFNCVLEPELTTSLSLKTTNEVLKRLVEYCGFTWNDTFAYTTETSMIFPEYLNAITVYFEKFKLETSLTCEVIGDLVDEIVNGVLKTGRLCKKGHVRKNWNHRWFVLQRTILRYYKSRDNMVLKGQLVLNGNTEVKSVPDRGKRKFCFNVSCGHTGRMFEITADDQRMKHEWMLAIRKAIALARVLDGSSKPSDFAESLHGFYLLKYGTSQPSLQRQDSTVRKMKFQATLKDQRQRLSGSRVKAKSISVSSIESSTSEVDEYLPMSPIEDIVSEDSSGDEDNYLPMKPAEDVVSDENYDEVNFTSLSSSLASPTTALPRILEPSVDDDTSEDSKSENDGKIPPTVSNTSLLSQGDDGGECSYIMVVQSVPNKTPAPQLDSKSSVSLGSRDSLEYEKPRDWGLTPKLVKEGDNPYLTLIHNDSKSGGDTGGRSNTIGGAPAVPAHRKGTSPLPSPVRHRSTVPNFDLSPPPPPHRSSQDVPPPVPDRHNDSIERRRSSEGVLPSFSPTHNSTPSSSLPATMTNTMTSSMTRSQTVVSPTRNGEFKPILEEVGNKQKGYINVEYPQAQAPSLPPRSHS